jgi:hypothetical protein
MGEKIKLILASLYQLSFIHTHTSDQIMLVNGRQFQKEQGELWE